MRARFHHLNTLRNQILVVFLLVMAIVLFFVGVMTFHLVSSMLKNNAEKQTQQTAVEAIGRLETLYRQIDTLSLQIVTNTDVQQQLLQVSAGQPVSFNQRQALMHNVSAFQAYSDGINTLELYTTDYLRLFPLDGTTLLDRVSRDWVGRADLAKGKMVWIGSDPRDPSTLLALRRVSLLDRWFSSGGYLLIRVNRSYFNLDTLRAGEGAEFMMLLDRNQEPLSTNYGGDIQAIVNEEKQQLTIHDKDYIAVKQSSELTGWTLIILSPVSSLTKGFTVLRTAIVASGVVGYLIFFVFSLLLSTMITRPILHLIKTMRGARLGELRPSPETDSTVEINELTKTYNEMVANINNLIQVIYEKELMRSRTELKALQAQINPHFLYNTLEALYWSLQEKEEEELADLVVAMSELFRYTIGNAYSGEWVTISKELDHIERYMQIMKLRFGERLTWQIDAPASCLAVAIPKLLIQPLVENAILHGVGNKKGPGTVAVAIRESAQGWTVEVTDDGPGMEAPAVQALLQSLDAGGVPSSKGSGLALANVNKRLQLYYKDAAVSGLTIDSEAGEGTRMIFHIPGGAA